MRGVLGQIKKYPKREYTKEESGIGQNGKVCQPVIGNQVIDDFMKQVERNKKVQQEADHKFQKFSKSITSKQKCILVELEIRKRMMFFYLQTLHQEVQRLKNISQKKLPPKYLQNQQKLHDQQELTYFEKLIIFQQLRIREAESKFKTAKTNFDILQHSVRKEAQKQKKMELSQQLQKVEKGCKDFNKQINQLGNQNKKKCDEKKDENNQLQEQKGNIRVYCRVRPAKNDRIDYEIIENIIRLKRDKNVLKSKNRVEEYEYMFEKIFKEDTPQNHVFDQLAELIQCSFDGKNVCIFAYGQTGSGKTHTMAGNLDGSDSQMRGFIPRSIEHIFEQVKIAQGNEYKPTISISIFQVYNDKIYDLLNPKPQKTHGSESKLHVSQKKLNEEKSIDNLKSFVVQSPTQAIVSLSNALKARATAETKMNTESSRSHLILEVKNQLFNPNTKITRLSSLVLVDLAGSQRQKDSGVTGVRLQEAKSINNSLTELGKVIRAIKDSQRPTFRNCKLTMVLQKYLELEGKAVMFVNVSPDKKDFDQTVNSLVFAQSVRGCKLKKNAHKNGSSDQSD